MRWCVSDTVCHSALGSLQAWTGSNLELQGCLCTGLCLWRYASKPHCTFPRKMHEDVLFSVLFPGDSTKSTYWNIFTGKDLREMTSHTSYCGKDIWRCLAEANHSFFFFFLKCTHLLDTVYTFKKAQRMIRWCKCGGKARIPEWAERPNPGLHDELILRQTPLITFGTACNLLIPNFLLITFRWAHHTYLEGMWGRLIRFRWESSLKMSHVL